ncbi:hypothetical protein C2G38_2184713 [Gigaspora rosea]|uniref:Uncharacterized protein n=1 Tax=Gigaspora rosea TaxID=44941 RepID=A0A397V7N5_9GLOM|nr:hypothetical protein C2G38_2184713 [Gigaspora rosea]
MYRRAVPVITSRIDMRSIEPEGLNRQSPSWVVGMATSVEPLGGLLKLDNQKLTMARQQKYNEKEKTPMLIAMNNTSKWLTPMMKHRLTTPMPKSETVT